MQTTMIEVILNDRLGKKVRVKCNEDDTIGDLKKLVAAQTGTRPEKIRIQVRALPLSSPAAPWPGRTRDQALQQHPAPCAPYLR